MRLRLILVSLMLLTAFRSGAVGGFPRPVRVMQPDGSTVVVRIRGDESFSYKISEDGYIIAQGPDGFYYYADYNSGNLRVSSKRVDAGSGGYAKTIPTVIYSYLLSTGCRALSTHGELPVATRALSSYSTIVIPVQFADEKFITPSLRSRVFNLFNQVNYSEDGASGSVRDYFRDNIGAGCNLSFDVAEPVTLQEEAAYYGANTSGVTDAEIKTLVRQACEAAHRQGVDFSGYDSDDDGVVDNVFIIFAGHNEAEGGGDDAIWPQSWNVSDLKYYVDGKRILNFTCCSELSGAYGTTFTGIGTICHEYCHFFGLKDMYDINGDTEGSSQGLFGSLSIMDEGCYNNDGKTPPYLNIVEREMLGLTSRTYIMNEGRIAVPPVRNAFSSGALRTSYNDEVFLLEYRDGSLWDRYAGGTGLVIYHVDRTDNDAGSMSARLRWKSNTVNGCAAHPCVKIVIPQSVSSPSVHDAFYPGASGISSIHSTESFALLDWSGRGVGFGLTNIRIESDSLAIDVVEDNSWDLPYVTSYSVSTQQRTALLSWEASGSRDGDWYLIWRKASSVKADTLVTKSLEYHFSSIEPDQEYVCRLFFLYKGVRGKAYDFSFHTAKMLSSFPLIGGMKSTFDVGEQIDLYVFNLVEDYYYIRWFLDDELIEGSTVAVRIPGKHRITAQIGYPDLSIEYLTKTIIVKE